MAARNIEDLHVSACYTGGDYHMKIFRSIFPEVKTIWAYDGSAPGAESGATVHERLWEAATRGNIDSLKSAIALHTRKGENVAVWSKRHGYLDNDPTPSPELRRSIDAFEANWAEYFNGTSRVTNPQSGPLRDYYANVQRLSNREDIPADERDRLKKRLTVTARLLFYEAKVAPNFAGTYSGNIKAGFESVGMQAPDFARLGRAEALAKIQEFKQRAGANPPAQASALMPLLDGLQRLNPSVIPEEWV